MLIQPESTTLKNKTTGTLFSIIIESCHNSINKFEFLLQFDRKKFLCKIKYYFETYFFKDNINLKKFMLMITCSKFYY